MRTDCSDNTLTIFLEGRIDSNNANEVEAQILELVTPEAERVQFDAEKLDYISSAGLRVLLKVRKKLKQPLPVLNVSSEVYEMLNAGTLVERILERPDRLPELAASSGRLLRQLHSTEVPEGQMPRASSLCRHVLS